MHEYAAAQEKQISINANIITELITRFEEMESLIETLEITLDKDLLKQLAESKREFAQGKSKTIKGKTELKSYLASLG